MEEIRELWCKLVIGTAVGTEIICGELLKLGRTEECAILKCLCKIVLTV